MCLVVGRLQCLLNSPCTLPTKFSEDTNPTFFQNTGVCLNPLNRRYKRIERKGKRRTMEYTSRSHRRLEIQNAPLYWYNLC